LIVVVDASFAVKWLVPEAGSDLARLLLEGEDQVSVPDLFHIEVASALCRKARQKVIGDTELDDALELLASLPGRTAPTPPLVDAAILLARTHRHALFDCLYLVLAQRSGAALATFDQALAALAGRLGIPLWKPA
jgi:predicted nucleic acid-binding protein